MAPTSRIYLTRHAEAEHNATGDSLIADALLTPKGQQQAERLAYMTPDLQERVELIVTSPLRRTLQTTEAGYKPAIARLGGHTKVICLPQLQECNDVPCDTGSARDVLESQPDFAKYDLSSLTPDWTSKRGFYAADPVSLDARAQWVRQFLRERPEQHIAVVAHGDFLRRLTDDPMSYWGNAEVRAFQFAPSSVATDACPIVHVEVIEKGDWNGEKVVSGTQNLSTMEARVKQIQASLKSQTNELEELDRMLEETERRQTELVSRASTTTGPPHGGMS